MIHPAKNFSFKKLIASICDNLEIGIEIETRSCRDKVSHTCLEIKLRRTSPHFEAEPVCGTFEELA